MKRIRLLLVVALGLSLLASQLMLSACFGNNSRAVAATVNGVNIMEQEVTDAIEAMRAQSGNYTEDVDWATALAMSGLTPESLRDSVIQSKIRDIIITQEAESQGFTIDDEAIDDQVAQTRLTVGADEDDAWLEMLQTYGYQDEKAYRDMLVINDLTMQLYDEFSVEPTDDELRTYIAQNPNAVDGFSLTGTNDTNTAADTPAGTEGEPAADAATDTEEPDVPTVSPDDVDLKTIPSSTLDEFKDLWSQNNKGIAFQDWIQELVDAADVVINPMPENVSYNVDMDLASVNNQDDEPMETPTYEYSSADAVASAVAQGLVITDEVIGTGAEAKPGSTVLVHYVGTLEDGTEFDSNKEGDTPFSFTLGEGRVIKGWDAGVVGMKVGGTRTLVIPAALAYGSSGQGTIPANATLHFTVELVEVK